MGICIEIKLITRI